MYTFLRIVYHLRQRKNLRPRAQFFFLRLQHYYIFSSIWHMKLWKNLWPREQISSTDFYSTIYLRQNLTTFIYSCSNYLLRDTRTNLFQKTETTSTTISTSQFDHITKNILPWKINTFHLFVLGGFHTMHH